MAARSPLQTSTPTPRGGRRRLPGHERRALILDAALRTFATHGYDGAAMDEIASAAGISKAVVYDHVPSKLELYTQLLHAIRTEIEGLVEGALRAPGADGEERVRAAVEAIFRYVEERPEAAQLLVLELQGANVSAIGRELEERVAADLARTLSDTPAYRGARDRETQLTLLAELLKSTVLGGAGWWWRNPEITRETLVARTVDVLWPAIERAITA